MGKQILILIWMLAIAFPNMLIAETVIAMKKESSGVYTLPCEVNGLKLRFILDTGASNVSISLTEASFMLKNGYLSDADIIGITNVRTADGKIAENYTIKLRDVQIGNIILHDVDAVVSNGLDAPLLLGQSVLNQLGYWSIRDSSLILNDSWTVGNTEYTWEQIERMLKENGKAEALNYLRTLVRDNNDYAAYLFLHDVSPDSKIHSNLIEDNEVRKSLEILTSISEENLDELYCNFERAIWFVLYRLGNPEKALEYLSKCENMTKMSVGNRDKLADYIMLYLCFDKINTSYSRLTDVANEFFSKKYNKAYLTYADCLESEFEKPSQSFSAHKRCADNGYIPAIIALGKDYLYGRGTIKNLPTALNLLEKGAASGYIEAISTLCEIHYFGSPVKQNYEKVLKYATLFGNDDETCDVLNKAYKGLVYFRLQHYRFSNQYLFDENLQNALNVSSENNHIWNAGLNAISSELLAIMGDVYANGLGVTPDFDKAFNYYSRLAEIDPSWGNGAIGDLFFINELFKGNAELAYHYYLLGANNESPYCIFRLALMNYYGVGTVKNAVKANDFKKKAIKGGIPASDFSF